MAGFNIRLRFLRQEMRLSQQELADRLSALAESPKGFSKSSINMYERGEREPSLDVLETIADFFNVDVDYLIGKSDVRNLYQAEKNSPPEAGELSDAQKDLIALVSRLPEDVCAAMLIALRQQFPPDDPDSR